MVDPQSAPNVNPSVRYEHTDVSRRWIIATLFGMVVVGVFLHAFVWAYFRGEQAHLDAVSAAKFPLAPAPATDLPRQPRLEQLDRLQGIDSAVFVRPAPTTDRLSRYGRAEQDGFVHIPIE